MFDMKRLTTQNMVPPSPAPPKMTNRNTVAQDQGNHFPVGGAKSFLRIRERYFTLQ